MDGTQPRRIKRYFKRTELRCQVACADDLIIKLTPLSDGGVLLDLVEAIDAGRQLRLAIAAERMRGPRPGKPKIRKA